MNISQRLSFLKHFDYFGTRFNFRFRDQDCYRTRTGGFVFIFYCIFSIYYIYFTLLDLLVHNNYTVSNVKAFEFPSPKLDLKSSNFSLGVGLTYENLSFLQPNVSDFFDLSLKLKRITNLNKIVIENKTLKECEKSDFRSDTNLSYISRYKNSRLQCAEINENMTVEGYFATEVFSFLELSVDLKEEYLTNNPNTTINLDYLTQFFINNPIKVILFWTDVNVNTRDYTNPVRTYFKNYVFLLDFYTMNKVHLDFSILKYSCDKNLLFQLPETEERITFAQASPFSMQLPHRLQSKRDGKKLVTFLIRSSPEITLIDQVYQKLPEFLANLGGLQSNILLVLSFCLNFFTDIWAGQNLMNNALRFRERMRVINPKELETMTVKLGKELLFKESAVDPLHVQGKKENYVSFKEELKSQCSLELGVVKDKSSSIDVNLEKQQRDCSKVRRSSDLENYHNIIHYIFKNRKPIEFRMIEIILRQCPNKRFPNLRAKANLYNKSSERVEYYFDVFTYMRKLEEVEILKYVLLNEDQRLLFGLLSKPSVSVTDDKDIYNELHHVPEVSPTMNSKMFDIFYQSYLRLKPLDDTITTKLMKLVNHELDTMILS